MVKVCNKCKEYKPISEFNKSSKAKDGLQNWCRGCTHKYRKENREKLNAYWKRYREENQEKVKAGRNRYRKENQEKLAAYVKKYREENQEKVATWQRSWKETNPKYHKEYDREYRKNNPEKISLWDCRRRARKLEAEGTVIAEQIIARWALYGSRCYLCGKPAEATDHVIPLAKGGSSWPANLRPICKSCNSVKLAKWPYPAANKPLFPWNNNQLVLLEY